jgi:hypothetical protein
MASRAAAQSGLNSTIDVQSLDRFETRPFDGSGMGFLFRYLELVPLALERLAKAGKPPFPLTPLLSDLLDVSKVLPSCRWNRPTPPALDQRIEGFKRALSSGHGQLEALLGRTALAVWEWGGLGQIARREKKESLLPPEDRVALEASFLSEAGGLRRFLTRTVGFTSR